MHWIWQNPLWPHFEFNAGLFQELEDRFLLNAGRLKGAFEHLNQENSIRLNVELLCQEAFSTSMIEGEILDRDSVQSSIRKHLGLQTEARKLPANASGVAEMTTNLYLNFDQSLDHKMLCNWHAMLMNGMRDIEFLGKYRGHSDAMQIVSGNISNPKVFYEPPPSGDVVSLMDRFVIWYQKALADQKKYPSLIFAAVAHVYFEQIHPFEDGNGRIGRALVEKSLSERMGFPVLVSISTMIEKDKNAYYQALQQCNNELNIHLYLHYFLNLILQAQEYSYQMVQFVIFKTKFFAQYKPLLNHRQEKVLLRIFEEGIEGFKGGLSAKNYQTISGAPHATTTRDLQELVAKGALTKTGQLKSTRYHLPLYFK